MAEQLQSVPACTLNVTDEQFRAVGHMTLQWAFLEGQIDREIVWLCEQSGGSPIKDYPFVKRAEKWLTLAKHFYADHPELIEGVSSVSEKAVVIKPERDKLVHCNLVSSGTMIRIRQGRVLDISDQATAPHIQDLACRISKITEELFQHWARLARVFDNPL